MLRTTPPSTTEVNNSNSVTLNRSPQPPPEPLNERPSSSTSTPPPPPNNFSKRYSCPLQNCSGLVLPTLSAPPPPDSRNPQLSPAQLLSKQNFNPKIDVVVSNILVTLNSRIEGFDNYLLEDLESEDLESSEMEAEAEADDESPQSEPVEGEQVTQKDVNDEEEVTEESDESGGGVDPVRLDLQDGEEIDRKRERKTRGLWETKKRKKFIQEQEEISNLFSKSSSSTPSSSTTLTSILPQDNLECPTCFSIYLSPITTPCGHTFCFNCLLRSLDHSHLCPICRSSLPSPNYIWVSKIFNKVLSKLLDEIFERAVSERKTTMKREEELEMQGGLSLPLFVCTLSFPTIPTFLHIFEPKYKLLIRRVLETEEQVFGMCLPKPNGTLTNSDGSVRNFEDYGTLLKIQNFQFLDDGRSFVETMGVGRFKVLDSGIRDGYVVVKITEVKDISPEEEIELERLAVLNANQRNSSSSSNETDSNLSTVQDSTILLPNVPSSPNEPVTSPELVEICHRFIASLRAGTAPWIIERMVSTFGNMPNDNDIEKFGWWMATVIPMEESEKVKLLMM
jgi:Lon protease-like protein